MLLSSHLDKPVFTADCQYLFLYRWPSFTLSSQKLCSGDWDRTLRISVWDWDSDGSSDFIGETTTTLRDIATER